jgi:predicted DNA-binding transcriptional regulator AlpA
MDSPVIETAVLLDIRGISQLARISDKTARRLARHTNFPQPLRIRGCVRWWRHEILAYLRDLSEQADGATGSEA